jgi:glycosyltransferase involved in cell wall biosynthesis
MKTALFLTAGPYFWPHQKTSTAKYEMYSRHFGGYIFSFVCSREWRRVDIGNFKLIGCHISDRLYGNIIARTLVRAVFAIAMSTYLHFFKRRLDVIITWDPFMTGLLGWMISKITGARLIVEMNGDYGEPRNWDLDKGDWLSSLKFRYVHLVTPFVMNRADGVKLLYPSQVAAFRGLKHPERFTAFHDLVPISQFHPGPPEARYALFIGHPWHRKGVDILIQAFDRVAAEFPAYRLKIVGYLPEREHYRHLFEHNPRIEFVGPVMPEEVPALMAGCSLFVLASRAEGMPRVLMEAMAARKPIIASAVSGIPSYIRHGETGLLFEREDVESLAGAMRTVMGDEAFAEALAERGYRYVHRHLSEARHIELLMAMIDEPRRGSSRRKSMPAASEAV